MDRSVVLLLTSLGIMLIGHGMQLTLLPLYARELGWSDLAVGITGASYFAGFVTGCFLVPQLLNRAGHIRVFMCATALSAAALLLIAQSESVTAWSLLRFITGLCLVSVYNTAEAWLNEQASDGERARLMSIYVIVTLIGIAIGQQLLGYTDEDSRFVVAVVVMVVSILPIGLFAADEPLRLKSRVLNLAMMSAMPKLAVIGTLLAGCVTGLVWTMAPLAGESAHLSSIEIGWMMNAVILGGVIWQYPLGYLSDRFPRNYVIAGAAALCALTSMCLFMLSLSAGEFIAAMFLLGGSSLTLYALCAAGANGLTTMSKVEIAGILLFCYGAGSVVSPLLVGFLSKHVDHAMFLVCGVSMIILALVAAVSKTQQSADIIQLNRGDGLQVELVRAA